MPDYWGYRRNYIKIERRLLDSSYSLNGDPGGASLLQLVFYTGVVNKSVVTSVWISLLKMFLFAFLNQIALGKGSISDGTGLAGVAPTYTDTK